MNHIKTALLMIVLTVLFVVLGGVIAGETGIIIALAFAVVLNVFSYWNSDAIAIRMTGSQPLSESQAPRLHHLVGQLAGKAGLPMPRVYRTPSSRPNAFATGRNPRHAAVAVTDGLVRSLTEEELAGVIAHELAHIKNRDTLIATIAAVMAGALTAIARIGGYSMMFGGMRGRRNGGGFAAILAIIFAPLAAVLIRTAVSRSREYAADRAAARIAGSPAGLAGALAKLEQASGKGNLRVSEAASHMFIVNPLTGGGMRSLFSTHPPTAERIRRLRQIEAPRGRPQRRVR